MAASDIGARRTLTRPSPAAVGSAAFGIAWASAVGVMSAASESPEPTAFLPRPLIVAGVFAAPPLIGLIGTLGDRRAVLVAAGILCVLIAPISFAGVGLPMLLPAIVLLRAGVATRVPAEVAPVLYRPMRLQAGRLVLGVGLCAAIAAVVIVVAGVVGVLVLVLLAVLTPALVADRQSPRSAGRPRHKDFVIAGAIVALVAAAAISAFGLTEQVCWVDRETPQGLVHERASSADVPPSLTTGGVRAGCSSGEPTPIGIGTAAVLFVGACGLAILADTRSESDQTTR